MVSSATFLLILGPSAVLYHSLLLLCCLSLFLSSWLVPCCLSTVGIPLTAPAGMQDVSLVRSMMQRHVKHTGSPKARALLADWKNVQSHFVKVFPHEYRRAMKEAEKTKACRPLPRMVLPDCTVYRIEKAGVWPDQLLQLHVDC